MKIPFISGQGSDDDDKSQEASSAAQDSQHKYALESTHEILQDAYFSDTHKVQENLASALGTKDLEGAWMKRTTSDWRRREETDDTQDYTEYPEYPLVEESAYDIPLITFDSAGSPAEDASALESGIYRTMSPRKPAKEKKISDIITRISDRIAGSNNPPTPSMEMPSSFTELMIYDNSDLRTTSSHANLQLDPGLPLLSIAGDSLDITSIQSHLSPKKGSDPRNLNVSVPTLQRSTSNMLLHVDGPILELKSPIQPGFESLYLYGRSLGIFPATLTFRIHCHRLASHPRVNSLLLALLFLQSGLLIFRQWNPSALYGYVYHGNNFADYILMVINIVYTVEAAVKIIAYGLYDDKVMFDELGLEYPASLYSETIRRYFSDTKKFITSISRKFSIASRKTQRKEILKATASASLESVDCSQQDVPLNHTSNYPENPFKDPTTIDSDEVSIGKSDFGSKDKIFRRNSSASISNIPANPHFQKSNTFLKASEIRKKMDDMNLRRAYLKSNWQKLDAISTACFWLSLLFSINRFDVKHHFMLFRSLSCLRIMRLCNLTAGTNIILKSCYSAIPQLVDISLVIICFWVFFGIIGVQSFKSSLSRSCEWTNPLNSSETYRNAGQYCGSYIGLDGLARPYLQRDGTPSNVIKGFRCPMYSVCKSGENPYSGTINFDNIFQSMELVFVVMSVNSFSDLMYDLMDSDNIGSSLFFVFAIFILTVWLMNVFIAIIVSSFKVVQMEEEEEYRQRAERGIHISLAKFWTFNNERFSAKVQTVVDKNRWLQRYYNYESFFVVVISSDLIVQCLRLSTMSKDMETTLYHFELALTCILLMEILLRLCLYLPDWRIFFSSRANCFDLLLGIITMIIIIDPVREMLGHAYFWLTFFQIARFYRVVLSRSITRDLWFKILRNAKAIFDLTLFYFLLLTVVSIILSRFFEGTIPDSEVDDIQFAMNTLPNSFMSLYVITSTEGWANIMYGLQEYSSSPGQRAIGCIFIIFWFTFSNSIVMNIFIAVIANAFQVSEEGKRKHQLRQFIDDVTTKLQTVQVKNDWINRVKSRLFKSNAEKSLEKAVTNLLLSGSAVNDFLDSDDIEQENVEENHVEPMPKIQFLLKKWLKSKLTSVRTYFENNPFFETRQKKEFFQGSFDPATFAKKALQERQRLIKEQDDYLRENPQFNSVFYVLEPNNPLRKFCQRIVPSSYGERIDGVEPNKKVSEAFALLMFLSTIGIVITACYLTPLFRREVSLKYGQWNWTFYIDIAFNVVFSMEFLIKITADGVAFSPNGYFRSPWNWIDFMALLSLWIEVVAFIKNDGNLSRIVSGLKAMRALRILTISETAKNNFQYTMISGFGKIVSAAIISITLIFPFSIWALNIFAGRLGYCNDGESYVDECVNEFLATVYNWDIYSPRVYVEPLLHLNDFTSSFSALYQIVSLEGWSDLLINVMQSTGVGTPQIMFHNVLNGAFIIAFNFLSVIFILTLFVSVIIDNYSKVTGRGYLTEEQIQWYHVKRFLLQVKPSKRNTESLKGIRKFCYDMTVGKNKVWKIILNVILFFHVLLLLCETFPADQTFLEVRVGCFIFNSSFFVANYVMLAVAQSYKVFIKNKWNVFSFVVSLGALVSTILTFTISSGSLFDNFNKLFLVSIMLFMIPRSDKINQILKFATASLPHLLSLIFTWFVIFLVYAIAMNQIFGMTKIGANTTENINLRSVPKALILLFRCSMGEGWNYIMDDFALEVPFCTPGSSFNDSDCGNKQYAYLMFMSWNVISMYIMLNLFISLILDSFSYISGGSNYSHLVSRAEIRNFKRAWEKFDPEGSGFIDLKHLPKLMNSLSGSLSFHFYHGVLSVPELCSKWLVRNNSEDPYDITIDYEAINNIVEMMDVKKIRERRALYEQFMEEARMSVHLHDERGISFSRLLVQIPLYNSFDLGQCLTLIDYLERRLLMEKLNDRLKKKRCRELIRGYIERARYLRQKQEKRNSHTSSVFSAESFDINGEELIL